MTDAQVIEAPAAADATETNDTATDDAARTDDTVLADLLVEEVSIDGMCGVY